MTVAVNGLRVLTARFVFTYGGPWFCDLDVDPDLAATMPTSGPASIVVGAAPGPVAKVLGTIDPLASGTFASAIGRMRVVGGALGWSKLTTAQHFNANPLTTTNVYQATAALVGETVNDLAPALLPQNYVRAAGPASRCFGDVPWWVDPATGVTFAGLRPPAVPDPSLALLNWDPLAQRAELVCDTLVFPATPLADTRIGNSPVTIADVEQTFDASGSRVVAWCTPNAVSRLQGALKTLVTELAKTQFSRPYRLRVAVPGADANHWGLQAVDRGPTGAPSPLPDLVPGEVWPGMSGDSAELLPSSEVLCDFEDGDPSRPRVRGFQPGTLPIIRTVDGSFAVKIGPSAAGVQLAGGATPLVLFASYELALSALETFAAAVGTATTLAQIIAAGAALATSLGAVPPAATLKTFAA